MLPNYFHFISLFYFTLDHLPLSINFGYISFWKWSLLTTLDSQWSNQQKAGVSSDFVFSESMTDMLRDALMNNSPYLLALTFLVSCLHSIFDMLAFKNDIQVRFCLSSLFLCLIYSFASFIYLHMS